jgi:hypothetical protein
MTDIFGFPDEPPEDEGFVDPFEMFGGGGGEPPDDEFTSIFWGMEEPASWWRQTIYEEGDYGLVGATGRQWYYDLSYLDREEFMEKYGLTNPEAIFNLVDDGYWEAQDWIIWRQQYLASH